MPLLLSGSGPGCWLGDLGVSLCGLFSRKLDQLPYIVVQGSPSRKKVEASRFVMDGLISKVVHYFCYIHWSDQI